MSNKCPVKTKQSERHKNYKVYKEFLHEWKSHMYNIVTLNVQFVNSRTVLKLSFKSFLLEYRTMKISPAFFHKLTLKLFPTL